MRGSAFHAGFFIALGAGRRLLALGPLDGAGYETRLAGLNARFATASA